MARVTNSIGSISGKLGDIIFCNGRIRAPYIRKKGLNTKPPTEAQLANRIRFKLANQFIGPFTSLVEECWTKKHEKQPAKLLVSILFRECFVGKYPDISLDYSKIPLSAGTLNGPGASSYKNQGDTLLISWEVPKNGKTSSKHDEVLVAAYNHTLGRSSIFTEVGIRGDGNLSLPIPKGFQKGEIHVWLIFRSSDGKEASCSTYLGTGE